MSQAKISNDIVGPGIIVGFMAKATACLMVLSLPEKFDGISNSMAALVDSLSYSIASVIIARKDDLDGTTNGINQESLTCATALTNLALIISTTSMFSRAQIKPLPRKRFRHKSRPRANIRLPAIRPILNTEEIPWKYLMFFIVGMCSCFALNVSAAIWNGHGQNSTFATQLNYVLLVIQGTLIVFTWFAPHFLLGVYPCLFRHDPILQR